VVCKDENGKVNVHIDGGEGNMTLGGDAHDGDIWLKTSDGKTRVELEGHDGGLRLLNGNGQVTVKATGKTGELVLGGGASDGDLIIKNSKGESVIEMKGNTGEIKVGGNTVHAADYVFSQDYNLLSLHDVKKFIQTNKHLPGVPSASQIQSEGLGIQSFTMKLLEKIEELTLHMIRQEETILKQQKEIDQLKL
jgi:hypothetical protein